MRIGSLLLRGVALLLAGGALWHLGQTAMPDHTEAVLMRYPFHHRETLRIFAQLNERLQLPGAEPERLQLRPLEIAPMPSDGERYLVMRDPSRISRTPLAVTGAGANLLELLDGTRSLDQVVSEADRLMPGPETGARTRAFVAALSQQLFLFDAVYRQAVIQRVSDFSRATRRDPITMGGSYPEDGAAAAAQVRGYLDAGDGAAPQGRLLGLIAPHIDYQRGHAVYGTAYRALAGLTGVRRFIILGTAHNQSVRRFAATRKDYWTSLGTATTDRDFLDRLSRRYPYPLFEDEFLHRGEHSIELELPFLQVLFGGNVAIVPILCGSLHDVFLAHADPMADPEVSAFVTALRATIAESDGPSLVIAAADLAHMGPNFGDAFVMDDDRLARLRRDDEALLARIAANDPRGFIETLSATGNSTRVCGAAPIYAALQILGADNRVEVLGYEQCTDAERFTTVTIPAAIVVAK